MNIPLMILGVILVAYGLFTSIMRIIKPGSFKKLGSMKERYGKEVASIIHFIMYSLGPLTAGAIIMYAGYLGRSIF